jgi:hypothetical protein
MSNSIPTVKLWRVTFEDGSKLEISAPTRRLALLNVRLGVGNWGAIRTIGLLRQKRSN